MQYPAYIMVADIFQRKAKPEDRQDLRQDVIVALAEVELRYQEAGKPPLSTGAMFRVASFTVAEYWRQHFRRTQGIDCSHCNKAQRLQCQQSLDRFAECPKRRLVVSLNAVVAESDGGEVELIDTIADDKAIDLDTWLDRKRFLYSLPVKLVRIAYRKSQGHPLSNTERLYLYRHSKKLREKPLIDVA